MVIHITRKPPEEQWLTWWFIHDYILPEGRRPRETAVARTPTSPKAMWFGQNDRGIRVVVGCETAHPDIHGRRVNQVAHAQLGPETAAEMSVHPKTREEQVEELPHSTS